jgi:hypothetical protein
MLWTQRNQEVHGRDERTRKEASQRETQRQLSEIYRYRTMYEDNVQQLLHRNAAEHSHQPISVTKNWIAMNTTIFHESYRRVKRKALSGMCLLRTYFGKR